MSAIWVDIGVNFFDKRFSEDQDCVIERARESDVGLMINIGTDLTSSEQGIELCQQHENLFCTVGIHPHDAKSVTASTMDSIHALLSEPQVVAIGETGLDFNRDFSPRDIQKKVFEQHLELASQSTLPLFLHERDAHKTQLEMLTSHRDDISGAVAHCFTGSREELYNYLDLDLYIGITGWLCDERRGDSLRNLVKDIPSNRLLLETDAPYLLPRTLKPKPKKGRNEPCFIPHIAETVSKLTQRPLEEIKQQCFDNSCRLFALKPQVTA